MLFKAHPQPLLRGTLFPYSAKPRDLVLGMVWMVGWGCGHKSYFWLSKADLCSTSSGHRSGMGSPAGPCRAETKP